MGATGETGRLRRFVSVALYITGSLRAAIGGNKGSDEVGETHRDRSQRTLYPC